MKSYKKGFTLHELIVSIAIFAFVAISVISFIVFINSFIKTSKLEQQKIQNQTLLQKYTNLWFSYFDNESYYFIFDNSSSTIVSAQHNNGVENYKIKTDFNSNGINIVFEFPQNSSYKNTVLSCNLGKSFKVKKVPEYIKEENFMFTVLLHVNNNLFYCYLSYM